MIIVVIYVLFIILYGIIKKVDCFNSFTKGVENNFKTAISLLPTIMGLVLGVNIFINSGIIEILEKLFVNSKIVPELIIQPFLKPISSSSSMLMMINIFEKYGVNSSVGKVSSILQGCSDTTIYILVIYFSSIKMKENKYALKAGLLTDFITFLFVFFLWFVLLKK